MQSVNYYMVLINSVQKYVIKQGFRAKRLFWALLKCINNIMYYILMARVIHYITGGKYGLQKRNC